MTDGRGTKGDIVIDLPVVPRPMFEPLIVVGETLPDELARLCNLAADKGEACIGGRGRWIAVPWPSGRVLLAPMTFSVIPRVTGGGG
ncbi:hypothetical protein HN937_18035 [Candidatus Poribacteria bacterium]|jgi:hypothetical protein|nr:hypothetical protein [Candidatus Poribacteria bacterium]